MTKTISKKDLASWLDGLMKDRNLIAPALVDKQTVFKHVASVDEIAFGFKNTALSPKEWFFPTTEPLFNIYQKDGTTELEPIDIEKESVIFGIRACDAAGIKLLDKVFLGEPADAMYAERRGKTTLIGLACSEAAPQCFCSSMGSAPNNAGDVDIMLAAAGEGYTVEAVTEKGKALISNLKLADSNESAPEIKCPTELQIKDVSKAMETRFEDDYWSRLADRCVHCNICAYVCPVCHCFDIRDYPTSEKTERIRCWDSCQSPGFTRAAGGHTPRTTKGSRLRQRFYHKLLYFPERFGDYQCTGCGRCVASCPVNIDIREIITDIQKPGVNSGTKA
ncbi:4Fe-4S dicluster domain-containing protein [Chloroflexota bacterium]